MLELDAPIEDLQPWLALVREARLTWGRAAARYVWENSPLPQGLALLDAGPADADAAALGALRLFLGECVRAAPGRRLGAARLYAAYLDWCEARSEAPRSNTWFGRALADPAVGLRKRRGRVVEYLDRALLDARPGARSASGGDYRADSDPLDRFLEECVRREPGADIQAAALYDAYKRWCAAAGEISWSAKGFGKALRERYEGFQKVKRNGCITYLGLRVGGAAPAGGRDKQDTEDSSMTLQRVKNRP